MPESEAELVVQTERGEPEVNLLVASVDQAIARFVEAGGGVVMQPFDIPIGRCAVVRDPWGTHLVLLDTTNDALATDADGKVIGVSHV
jgi:predicted enzyme related to lactoylglutathione lyase